MNIKIVVLEHSGRILPGGGLVGTQYVYSEDEFRFALHSCVLDGTKIDSVSLPNHGLGLHCRDTWDKMNSISDVKSDKFVELEWRGQL